MASILVDLLTGIAPEAAQIIEKLQKAKLNQTQQITALLAINLETLRKQEQVLKGVNENCQGIRDIRADICDLKGFITRKGN